MKGWGVGWGCGAWDMGFDQGLGRGVWMRSLGMRYNLTVSMEARTASISALDVATSERLSSSFSA